MHDRPIRDALRSVLVACLFTAWPAAAATITVTTLADELNADGDSPAGSAVRPT